MARRPRLIALLAFLLVLTAGSESAWAFSGQAGASVGGSSEIVPPGSGGGGGSGANINDLRAVGGGPLGVGSYRLAWKIGWHAPAVKASNCTGQLHMCVTREAVWTPPASAGELGTADNAGSAFSKNVKVAQDIGWTNECRTPSEGSLRTFSGCYHALNGIEGPFSWAQVHSKQPGTDATPVQAVPAFASIRIWRECRIDPTTGKYYDETNTSPSPGMNGQRASVTAGETCSADPIFERVAPASDASTKRDEYFRAYSDKVGSNDVRSMIGGSNMQSLSALGKRDSAGVLYGSCRDAGNRSLCLSMGKYDPPSSYSTYEQACTTGGITPVKWSDVEFISEVKGRGKEKGSYYYSKWRSLVDWRMNRMSATNKWPEYQSKGRWVDLPRSRVCSDLVEWFAVDWKLGGSSYVKTRFNGIPGHLYAVQIVFTDNRENILKQKVQMVTSSTETGLNVVCTDLPHDVQAKLGCGPNRTKRYCEATDGSGAQVLWPDSQPMPARCGSPEPPPSSSSQPSKGDVQVQMPGTTLVGNPAEVSVNSEADSDHADSLWVPRTLKTSIFNLADHSKGRYAANHRVRIEGSTPGRSGVMGGSGGRPTYYPAWLNGGAPLTGAASNPTVLGADVPLLVNADRTVSGKVDAAVLNPTLAPRSNVFDDLLASHELRFSTLLGESRYLLHEGNTAAAASLTSSRLTLDECNPGERRPKFLKHGDGTVRDCTSGTSLDEGWHVEDAYTLPQVDTGRPVEAATVFTQDASGPASLKLQGPLAANAAKIEVYSLDDYVSGGDAMYYVAQPQFADGEIRFCKRWLPFPEHFEWYETVPAQPERWDYRGSVPHWQPAWGEGNSEGNTSVVDAHSGDPANHPYYTTAYWGGDASNPPDVLWYTRGNGAKAYYKGGKYFKLTYDANMKGVSAVEQVSGSFDVSKWTNEGWGREWWYKNSESLGDQRDVGSHGLWSYTPAKPAEYDKRPVRDPSCLPQSDARNAVPTDPDQVMWDPETPGVPLLEELPAGTYVIRYELVGPIAAGSKWGIAGNLMTNPTREWALQFTFDQTPGWLQVYRSRAVG